MRNFAIISILTLVISACDTQVKNYVRGAQPGQTDNGGGSTPSSGNWVKISPGSVRGATSADMGLDATVTHTNIKATSASLGLEVGISKRSR